MADVAEENKIYIYIYKYTIYVYLSAIDRRSGDECDSCGSSRRLVSALWVNVTSLITTQTQHGQLLHDRWVTQQETEDNPTPSLHAVNPTNGNVSSGESRALLIGQLLMNLHWICWSSLKQLKTVDDKDVVAMALCLYYFSSCIYYAQNCFP